ncbi:hypothetical protein FEDK69T_10060 [Flavobacterium enshiense DK69]|uniref:DUF5689 domain-containing protein n=1 Tax=Flavobacterium enshiense DK69 TaxID=1107311 RepID=V6SBV1_9FLAO|nr:DUF5689 domain-containing protein [Flavobacterium enshiense]ESU23949.1 hypothetical protein FEDK69T_10060 [Flavobacterium enshiense DK69]KGO96258.1 hypothetical protein Q767_08390 [Flavobacterium enshiense DK69]
MKTRIIKSALLFAFLGTALTGCVNGDDYNTPDLQCIETTLAKTKEVSEIPVSGMVAQYTEDDVIEAYATSSDQAGNFFKSISFQTLDGSKAFSVPTEYTSSFIDYQPGKKVLIKLKGLYTNIKDGGMVIGGIYLDNGVAQVGRLSMSQTKNALKGSCTTVSEEQLVQHVTLAQLSTNTDSYLNKLIEVENVQLTDAAIGKHYYEKNNEIGGGTNHYITDKTGTQMVFRTSKYAQFAHKLAAIGSGKIRGVLTRYGDTYQFMVRYERDIMLNNPRFGLINPFYTEDFQSAANNTNLNIPGWTNYAQLGNDLWKEKIYLSNGYAELSAFGSGDAQNVAWLVTPAINLNTFNTHILKFDACQHHLDVDSPNNSLEVLISTDFDGTNVQAATWTAIPYNAPVKDTPDYEFLTSTIDLSSYSGNIYVAFKFKGSGTDNTLDGAFQVDNLKVFGFNN